MIFTEARFVLFFGLVWAVHWALPGLRARKTWLLATSCFFYGLSGVGFLALMLATALVDYGAGLLLGRTEDPRRRRWILALSLTSNLGVLGFFKYAGFFAASVQAGLARLGVEVSIPTLSFVLPVGISFYTFQSISYAIDVYRRTFPPTRSVVDFLFYVTFFPQLVAGPIVRARDFLPQTRVRKHLDEVRYRPCLVLFLVGFFKKACVADALAPTVDAVFADPGAYSAASLWLADLLYVVQIYCDFSGYTDMALALAGLLGYRLTPNFDFPYLSTSVTEFWRRWHISLSSWFRDYLYVSLGGNRRGRWITARNLFVVFVLCGLWHGANWTFIVFGLVQGAALCLERAGLGALLARAPRVLAWAWMASVLVLSFVLFRAHDLGSAWIHLVGMFGAGAGDATVSPAWWLLLAALFVVHLVAAREALVPSVVWTSPRWGFALGYGSAVALILPWISVGYAPFLYFRF